MDWDHEMLTVGEPPGTCSSLRKGKGHLCRNGSCGDVASHRCWEVPQWGQGLPQEHSLQMQRWCLLAGSEVPPLQGGEGSRSWILKPSFFLKACGRQAGSSVWPVGRWRESQRHKKDFVPGREGLMGGALPSIHDVAADKNTFLIKV